MAGYRATIGLEIHAELKTATKMFCSCRNDPDEKEPNKNVCAVCLAHPGALPVINKEAVKKVLLVGAAVGGRRPDYTEFDRKNYFYPDIPKGYQISQYKYPLVAGGALGGVALTRVHLEEDTARSQHEGERSMVDYNRAGVPLMELVTEPVIHDVAAAGAFARELQLLLRTLGAGEANMEKGEMRVEANISVSRTVLEDGLSKDGPLGVKVEVKNLNSFRSVERAIAFELKRQEALLERGEKVVQETRGWDENKQETFSQRKKESSHDYRYFPDPDLPPLMLGGVPGLSQQALERELPELPWAKRERYARLGFLQAQDIEQLVEDAELADFFDSAAKRLGAPGPVKAAANLLLNFVAGIRKDKPAWLPDAEVFVAVIEKNLPAPQAKSSLLGGTVAAVADARALPAIAQKVIEANPGVVADYKAGKTAALQFLVGQGMKESRGSADPQALRGAIQKILG
jgi:aspartyl-tRNA(Asn)/glutamyl-tRNA(Gln) amidotransferase subunit B